MKASVIIPNLNGAGWLRDSIESVWAQTEQDFELIVIDNGSTDESLEIARSYRGHDRYTLIENATNTGFSHAVNQGIAIAQGEYVALFNNDAFAEPDWLAELLKTADADPKIFAVSSLMLRYYEPELADDAGDYVTILGFACKRGDGLKASRYQKPCRVFSACGGAALYRKSILDEIGVFDELFFAYYEDVDLSWRANNFGYKNVYCPTARCRHICGATTPHRPLPPYLRRHHRCGALQSLQEHPERPQQHPAALQEPAAADADSQLHPHAAGIPSESGHVPAAGLRRRLRQRLCGSKSGPAQAQQAEIPLAQSAQLYLGGMQPDRGAVPVHRLPGAAGFENHLNPEHTKIHPVRGGFFAFMQFCVARQILNPSAS